MITKKLKRAGNDLFFICFSCKKNTYVRDILPILGQDEEMEKYPHLRKTSKTAPLGTAKTFFSSIAISLIVALFVSDILDMPPFLTIACFGFVFEFIVNPILLHFGGLHRNIWLYSCENCNSNWQLVVQSKNSMLLVFRFLF